ncbi:MAG: DNA polymerase IV [Solirubrobacterales bacterium]|nr:DNA polymerase IV [Solirubrobacterales bacterium]
MPTAVVPMQPLGPGSPGTSARAIVPAKRPRMIQARKPTASSLDPRADAGGRRRPGRVNRRTSAYDGPVAGRRVAHLDMDAFYVAVELLRRPELRGKPVIVAGRGPRAVVTTASYEARPYGVGSAMPVAHARRSCPDLVHLPVDMAHYRERSREVMALIAALELPIEPVSLDEVYVELTSTPDPVSRMSGLVREIRERFRLDASVGIGPNKLVAKVASDAEKPCGFVVLTREQAAVRFASAPPRLIPGVGPKTAERLAALGVETIGALQRHPADDLIRRFGQSHGRALHERAHFRDESPVARGELKSRSVETTFDRDIADLARLEGILTEQAQRLGAELARREHAGRTIAIKVRLDDWTTYTRARSLEEATLDVATITAVACELLRRNPPARPVRLLGVRVGGFATVPTGDQPAAAGQNLSLLDAA